MDRFHIYVEWLNVIKQSLARNSPLLIQAAYMVRE